MFQELQKKISNVFKPLTFDEINHIYYWYGNKVTKSVSKKIEEHYEKFDANKIVRTKYGDKTILQLSAAKQTRLRGIEVTEHELMHEWQTTNKNACELGHETHDYMEYYNGIKLPDTPQKIAGVKFLKAILSETFVNIEGKLERRYEILFRELRMYSLRFRFAGTADLILADKMLRTIVIGDYKTNKDLWKIYGNLKEPFSYLESHPYNKYQLQLSYYHLIFEEMTGIKVNNRILAYLKADETYETYNLADFTSELKLYLIAQQKAKW